VQQTFNNLQVANTSNPFLALVGRPAPKPVIDFYDHLLFPQKTPTMNFIDEDPPDSSGDANSAEFVPPLIPHGPVEW
jgi:hypothetical protein